MRTSDEDETLLKRAAAWDGTGNTLESLNEAQLAELTGSEGIEFATAVLYDRLRREERNAKFWRRAEEARGAAKLQADLVGVVPGAFHREHRDTGADGGRVLEIARTMGCAAEVIPTANLGTLEENARLILDWLGRHRGKRVVLVSLCKGSADLKHAFGVAGARELFAEVAAWVSLSGLVYGTPLVAWLRNHRWRWWAVRLLLWWKGHPARTLDDMRRGPGTMLAGWPEVPGHVGMAHVYGFPLERHLAHRWAPKAYRRLAPLGPNDGGAILLGDAVALPGAVCPLWGVDHYLMPAWDVIPTLRGIVTAAASGAAPRQASQCASTPTTTPASKSSA